MLSKDEEKELREVLKETYLEGHPNPERRDCPGSDVLKAIASGKLTLEESEPWIHHFTRCSPCTGEFAEFRKEYKRRRLRQVAGLAACVLVLATLAIWLAVRRPARPGHLQPLTIDLSNWATLRGPEGNANPPLQLAKGDFNLTLYLPAGNEPGTYDVQVFREPGHPLWSTQQPATFEDYKATLRLRVDLRQFSPGLYLLAFRRQGRSWTYIPLVLK